MLLLGSISSQKIPGTPKQERKLPVKQHLTVQSTPRRTPRPPNFEGFMWRDFGAQTDKYLFELLDPDFSLYRTGYSKYLMILELRIQKYPTKIKEWKKEICSSDTTVQGLKSKNFSLEKVEDHPNAVRFYTGLVNNDALLVVFKCLEQKSSQMHFWLGANKCNNITIWNDIIPKWKCQ